MRLTLAHKLSLGAILLVLLSVSIVGGIFYSKTTDLLVEQSVQDLSEEIRNVGTRIQTRIDAQRADTLYLSGTPPIQGILRALDSNNFDALDNSSYQQWVKRLESIFSTLLKSKGTYLKIRFIDSNGQELVVVGNENNSIIIYSGDKLQNKAQRTYTRETLKLKPGKVYLSEINLNKEHGRISVPHQEVIRSATPVYNETTNEVAGIIVIASEIGHEFKRIQQFVQDDSSEVYITNDFGGYLLHPDASRAYGFDLGKHYRFQEDFPRLALLYLPENTDSNFVQLPERSTDKHVVNFTKIPFDPDRPKRFIAVGITKVYKEILHKQASLLNDLLFIAFFLTLIVSIVAILFSIKLSRPIKQLTQVMDDYTHNRDSTATMPVNQHDEIGILVESYNKLIQQEKVSRENLEELNANLGNMVTQRTLALKSSETLQRSIVENMIDGLITIDEQGTIISFNPASTKIFGYEPDEIIGKNVSLLMPDPFQSNHDNYLKSYQESGIKNMIGSRRESSGKRKDGSVFPIDIGVGEINVNGDRIFSGVIRDITEQKQMEKMKNEFVSTVSHELRTPLTAIRGSLGLINGGAMGEIPDKAANLLTLAGNNTERLLLLINDILDIQKIESGKMEFHFVCTALMPFIRQAVLENKAYGEQYKVEFVISDTTEDTYVFADEGRLKQVIANLLSNAAKFSPKNSSVEICVDLSENENVLISISDHGTGIPEEFRDKLFEKFTQSDSSTTRRIGGTGLGLSITKAIVEKHNGKISYTSKTNEGTTFVIELPTCSKDLSPVSKIL